MKLVFINFFMFSFIFLSVAQAGELRSETMEEGAFPNSVIIKYNNEKLDLSLTGLTVRKKFFLKIYSMAHYIEQKPKTLFANDEIYQYVLQSDSAKQISMVFLRTLKAEQIKKSLLSGIKSNISEDEYLQIQPQVELFMRAISEDVKENDEFTLRWLPDGTMISLFQGKEISSIKGENFARTIWSIWFGDHSVIKRDLLIKELLTSS